jgi:hypothetical protein
MQQSFYRPLKKEVVDISLVSNASLVCTTFCSQPEGKLNLGEIASMNREVDSATKMV